MSLPLFDRAAAEAEDLASPLPRVELPDVEPFHPPTADPARDRQLAERLRELERSGQRHVAAELRSAIARRSLRGRPEPAAALVPLAVAADLLTVDVGRVEALIAAGAVRCERIKGRMYVDLDAVELALGGTNEP